MHSLGNQLCESGVAFFVKRRLSAQHGVEYGAGGPHVDFLAVIPLGHHFGRLELKHSSEGFRQVRLEVFLEVLQLGIFEVLQDVALLGHVEIRYLNASLNVEEDVAWLQVAVRDVV